MPPRDRQPGNGILLQIGPAIGASVAVVIWAAWFPVTKIAVSSQLNEWQICVIRFMVSGIISIPILSRLGFGTSSGFEGIRRGIALALFAGIGYVSIATCALEFAPSTYGMVTPVSMATAGTVWVILSGRHRWNGAIVTSFCLFAFGILLLASGGHKDDSNAFIGLFLFMLAGLSFAFYNIAVAAWRLNPFHATALVAFYSLLFSLPIGFWQFHTMVSTVNITDILIQGFYQGFLVSYAALLFFTYAIKQLGVGKASYITLAVPATTAILSYLILGEHETVLTVAAICTLIGGMLFGVLGQAQLRRLAPSPGGSDEFH